MILKRCGKCGRDLARKHFPNNQYKKDGKQCWCFDCYKQYHHSYYVKNKRDYLARNRERRQKTRLWWREFKLKFKCSRCGEDHPACIQFHHISDDKIAHVARLIHRGCKTAALAEIAKCIPLCANCHAKEHWKPN